MSQETAAVNDEPPNGSATASAAPGLAEPDAWPLRADITPAGRDPFVIYVAPPPARPPMVVAAPVVTAPLVPREPLPSLIFSGRMRTPDGRTVVLARWADGTTVSLEAGKELGKGYRVERMTEQSVDLLNPQTQAMVQLLLPAAPRFEIR